MKILDKLKKKHNGMTLSPDCFLPFIITEQPDEIIKGNITLNPILSSTEVDELLEDLKKTYPAPSIENGYLLNLAEIFSLSISVYPMTYKNRSFAKVDKRFSAIGSKAVVILNPMEFIERLQRAVAIGFPNLRFLEVGSIQYSNADNWSLYSRNNKDAWKQEFLISAKLSPMLRFEGSQYAKPVTFNIGDLSKTAVVVEVKDLIKGRLPSALFDNKLLDYIDTFVPTKKGVQNFSFSVMADVHSVVPDKKWISLFDDLLGNEWVANTSVERLFIDGEALPRLVYHHCNMIDKIHIGINRIDVTFAHYTDRERRIIRELFETIDKELGLRFCRMIVVTNANLGTATEHIADKNAFVKETKVKNYKGLQITHDIETDYCVSNNILGINASQRAWHYVIKTETPEYEQTIWYNVQDIIDFFEEASEYNVSVINGLLRGRAYARYRKI